MTLLDHGQPADTTTEKRRTGLIAVLAVLAVALLAAGAWLFADRQQQAVSAEEQQAAIMEVVTAHNTAYNAHDRDALRATLTDDFTWTRFRSDDPGIPLGLIPADEYADLANYDFAAETFTGVPVFSGDLQVSIPVRRQTLTTSDGTYTFTLREIDGQLKIASMVFEES